MSTPTTPRILIVDDEPQLRRLNECSLRRGGFDSFYFGQNGREAVELAGEMHPDLIIIDFTMPEMDGLHALRELKSSKKTADIPVIMISGCSEMYSKRRTDGAAANTVLKKPCNPALLLEAAQRALAA